MRVQVMAGGNRNRVDARIVQYLPFVRRAVAKVKLIFRVRGMRSGSGTNPNKLHADDALHSGQQDARRKASRTKQADADCFFRDRRVSDHFTGCTQTGMDVELLRVNEQYRQGTLARVSGNEFVG